MDGNSWDLFAVVRSCSAAVSATATKAAGDSISSLHAALPPAAFKEETHVESNNGQPLGIADIMVPSANFCDEQLEDICKPYYIEFKRTLPEPQLQRRNTCTSPGSCVNSLLPVVAARSGKLQQQQSPSHRSLVSQAPRSKRRKSQLKKVVYQVAAADGASPDLWAWRKYGQKPIKGSPYPRGYYRCSSSKGCQAKKQVERSWAEPGTLLITYTAEHNHPVPIHRSSLAGTTRQRFPLPKSSQQVDSLAASGAGGPIICPLSSQVAAAISIENEVLRSLHTTNKVHKKYPQEEDGGLLNRRTWR